MKVTRKFNQSRRDLYIDMECEKCGAISKDVPAYDDRNFWDNVVPDFKCDQCGESTKSLGLRPEYVGTKYADYETV